MPSRLVSRQPLFCLHTYWILGGSAHKYCFLWVNIRLAIGWGDHRASLSDGRVGGRALRRDARTRPGRELFPSPPSARPLILALRFAEATGHDGPRPWQRGEVMADKRNAPFSLPCGMLLSAHLDPRDRFCFHHAESVFFPLPCHFPGQAQPWFRV